MQLNRLAAIFTMVLSFGFIACSESDVESVTTPANGVEVGLWLGDSKSDTRTTINDDGISTSWSKDDKVALWAVGSDGNYALSNQTFKLYFRDLPSTNAFFTTTLSAAMAEGTYTYYATYPTPKSVSGTTATFNVPSVQDGTISNGAAVMVATPTESKALRAVTNIPGDYEVNNDGLSLRMNHALHALRFYVPSTKWGFADGETVEQIVVTMPHEISGDYTLDYTNSSAATTVSNGSNKVYVTPKEALLPSAYPSEHFVAASIIPYGTSFADGDVMTIKVTSQSHYALATISLNSRGPLQAGHITPVSLDCSDVHPLPRIMFRIASNNLGEQPYRITLTAEDTSAKWLPTTNHIYTYYTGSDSKTIANGSGFDLAYDLSTISSISGKRVKVSFETKSAIVSQTITMPVMTPTDDNSPDYSVSLNVPYLFTEDFSTLQTYDGNYTGGPYTSVDGASTAALDLSQYGLSAGWSGARTGCDAAGVAILVSGRVDAVALGATRAYGRLESPALSMIKPDVKTKIKVSFTYSGREEENYSYYYPVGKCGYTTLPGLLNGYATQFNNNEAFSGIDGATNIPSIPTNGSAAAATNYMEYTISNCTSTHRLSWHVMQFGFKRWATNNDYGILYIDNIKVQIVQ